MGHTGGVAELVSATITHTSGVRAEKTWRMWGVCGGVFLYRAMQRDVQRAVFSLLRKRHFGIVEEARLG